MLDFDKFKSILLEALLYPWYAKPEFLIKKQKESDWSKYVFLSSLRDIHTDYLAGLTREIHNERKLNPNVDESLLGLSIESETNGKIKEVHVDYGKRSTVINRDVLQMLIEAIDRANVLDEPKALFSDFQIITLFETVLRFIKDEFEVQAGIKEDTLPFARSAPKGFNGKTDKGEKMFLLHFYHIKGPEPILDFTMFKHAIRNLLISSPHPERLAMMLKPRIDEVKEVVRIWNHILQPLDAGIGNAVTYRRLIEFQTKKEDWIIWYDAKIMSFQENSTRYTNYDLVRFVFDAGNIIANEVSNDESIDSPKKENELKSIFSNEAAFQICIDLLDDLEITIEGNSREKIKPGKLSGAIMAMKETPGLFKVDTITEKELIGYFNTYLQTSIKSMYKRSKSFDEAFDDAKNYLKQNYKTNIR